MSSTTGLSSGPPSVSTGWVERETEAPFTLPLQGRNLATLLHLTVDVKVTKVEWENSFIPPLILLPR